MPLLVESPQELDLLQHASSIKTVQLKLDGPANNKPKPPRKVQASVPDDELRRSNRDVKRPSYRSGRTHVFL